MVRYYYNANDYNARKTLHAESDDTTIDKTRCGIKFQLGMARGQRMWVYTHYSNMWATNETNCKRCYK